MSKGIVFFSRSNNTRVGAEYLAGRLEAKSVELVEKNGRKGLIGFIKSGYQATTGKISELQGEPWKEIENCSTLYLMTPIWGGNITPAMNAFLHQADLKGKEVTAITFQADLKGEGSEKVHDQLKSIVEKSGGVFLKGFALHSALPGKFAGKDYIQSQVDSIV